MIFWRHYVYAHARKDTGEVFYIGKGTIRERKKSVDYERAFCFKRRSDWWGRVAAKHGVKVEIIAMLKSDEDACLLEIELIEEYGREKSGGSLVNLTDGGEGTVGAFISNELRVKRSINAQGKRSKAWCESIKLARKNGGNGGVVKQGDKLNSSWRKNISKGVTGIGNSQYGRTGAQSSQSLKVIDQSTGAIYDSILLASEFLEIPMKRLHSYLRGYTKNKTTMRLV